VKRAVRGLYAIALIAMVLIFPDFAQAQTVPGAPAGVELHANVDSSITLYWTASTGATSYNIYRGTSSGGEGGTPIATTSATT